MVSKRVYMILWLLDFTCACGSRSVPVPSSHCILLLNVDGWSGGWDGGTPAYSST